MTLSPQDTLADLATRLPAASRIFHDAGIDYCCGGRRSLGEACAEAGLSAASILERLEREDPAEIDWFEAPMDSVIDHLLASYHEPHRAELPQLVAMAAKVEEVHAEKDGCPVGLAAHLRRMDLSLREHMDKEEQVLFPLIRHGAGPSAAMPVRIMTEEHDEHAANLRRMRELANGFVPPEDACTTWRALYLRLDRLEQDLMDHVHLENNVLFPRALREPETAQDGGAR